MKVNQLKWGAIISNVQMVLGFLISLVYTPLMLRLMGQSEYGLYNLVLSVVSYLGVLNFGFTSAYMRFFSRGKIKEDKEKLAELNGMFLLLFLALATLALVAGTILSFRADLIFGNQLSPEELGKASVLMIILSINLAFGFTGYIFASYIRIHERFVFQKLVTLIRVITQPFVVIPIVYMGYGSIGMGITVSLLNIAVEIAHIIYCFRILDMRFSFKNRDSALMKEMGRYSFYIFIGIVVDQVYNNYGKFIVGRIHGTIAVAIFGVGHQLKIYFEQIGSSISNVFVPRVHRLVAEGNNDRALTHLMARVGRIQFIGLGLIFTGFLFFGKPFIVRWAGPDYFDSYYVSLILMAAYTISLLQFISLEVQRAKNLHKKGTLVILIFALISLGTSVPLTRFFGSAGAALGTAISMFLGHGVATSIYNHRNVGLDMKYYWTQILRLLPSLVIPVIFGLILNWASDGSTMALLISALLFTVVYVFSFWLIGMNAYEKNLIGTPLRKIRGRFQR